MIFLQQNPVSPLTNRLDEGDSVEAWNRNRSSRYASFCCLLSGGSLAIVRFTGIEADFSLCDEGWTILLT